MRGSATHEINQGPKEYLDFDEVSLSMKLKLAQPNAWDLINIRKVHDQVLHIICIDGLVARVVS